MNIYKTCLSEANVEWVYCYSRGILNTIHYHDMICMWHGGACALQQPPPRQSVSGGGTSLGSQEAWGRLCLPHPAREAEIHSGPSVWGVQGVSMPFPLGDPVREAEICLWLRGAGGSAPFLLGLSAGKAETFPLGAERWAGQRCVLAGRVHRGALELAGQLSLTDSGVPQLQGHACANRGQLGNAPVCGQHRCVPAGVHVPSTVGQAVEPIWLQRMPGCSLDVSKWGSRMSGWVHWCPLAVAPMVLAMAASRAICHCVMVCKYPSEIWRPKWGRVRPKCLGQLCRPVYVKKMEPM